jgi:hypothetical protein
MFEYLSGVGAELHAELVKMYWVLLVPYVLFFVCDGNFKRREPKSKRDF